MADGLYLENRYDFIFMPLVVRFGRNLIGRLVHNDMPTTVIWSKGDMVKIDPEVEFQYGGHLFFQTGTSYIPAVD